MDPSPPPPSPRQRPIGHAILAIAISFVVVLILDADGLHSTARQLPYGTTERAVATALTAPLADVADALRLNRPLVWADDAVGKHSLGTSGDPFAVSPPPPGSGAAPPGTPGASGHTGAAGPRRRTPLRPAHPLRVLVVGDSLAGDFGPLLMEYADRTGVMRPAGPVDFRIGTGLARPDVFDWPAQLRRDLAADHPGVVVIATGLNDDQPMVDASGHYLPLESQAWLREYRRRVTAMMEIVLAAGAKVIYVAPPATASSSRNAAYLAINRVVEQAAAGRPDVRAYGSYLRLDPRGVYAPYLTVAGKLVAVRLGDGTHLSAYGDQLVAAQLLRTLTAWYRFPHAGIF